jgi:formylglycine-generating enzyme required for sulfatase activity
MKHTFFIYTIIALCAALFFGACEDPTKSDPELTDFTFTPASLQEGGGAVEGMKAGDIVVSGGTAPYTITLEADDLWGKDNGKFSITGTELVINQEIFGGPHYVKFRVTDSTGKSLTHAQIIFIAFKNGPTGLEFTPAPRLMEGVAAVNGLAPVGSFIPTGGMEPYTYSLVPGAEENDADNGSFRGSAGGGIYAKSALDAGTYNIYARVVDKNGKIFEKPLTVIVAPYTAPTFGADDFAYFPANLAFEGNQDYYTSVSSNGSQSMNLFLDDRPLPIPAFKLARYETTEKLWWDVQAWATANGYTFITQSGSGAALPTSAPTADNEGKPKITLYWRNILLWLNAFSEKNSLTPVYYSDADFAQGHILRNIATNNLEVAIFTNWTANGYRLPSEVEWEYAARGGVPSFTEGDPFMYAYAGTNDLAEIQNYAWTTYYSTYFGTASPDYAIQQVGRKLPNTAGLYDMSGNAAEFCGDYGYGGVAASQNVISHTVETPTTGPDQGNGKDRRKILKGGSYNVTLTSIACREVAWLSEYNAPTSSTTAKTAFGGFRIAQTAVME